ncbi:MAG: radical SAM protein [Anaerolineae bacterium]|nr:MAG: radical SAM protein [Anaerolineae bacterium]
MASDSIKFNRGTRAPRKLPSPQFPSADAVLSRLAPGRSPEAVDVLLVNPPAPDQGIWIRSQHRVGRRSRENMIWPQCSLAQMAALLMPDYTVEIVDAIAMRMTWEEFHELLRRKQPRYYLTQVTAPTLTNDMHGTFLAKSLGAKTIAFGTHVTPIPGRTMEAYPSLDFVLKGEPELTLRELIDSLERRGPSDPPLVKLFGDTDPEWQPLSAAKGRQLEDLSHVKGLVWRHKGGVIFNDDRPFIANLDDLPLPRHGMLPMDKYRIPNIKGPYTFIVTSRGCTAGCKFCIKHVSYQYSIRLRSPENIMAEIRMLYDLGIRNIHMYADLFTVSRDQVMGLCKLLIESGLKIKWTCNSRVDYVDEEMLQTMAQAGCWYISWGLESANVEILRNIRKGTDPEKMTRALNWSKKAGIRNWGYFIIGLPGETEETIQETIALSKKLPLDIALFHIAAPYPGTPFFFEVVENNWFRPGTQWEEVDMDRSTVLDYPGLPAEQLEYWQRRAFREWAMRPGPILTYLKSANSLSALRSFVDIGWQTLSWVLGFAR